MKIVDLNIIYISTFQHLGVLQSSSMGWNGAPGPGVVGSPLVKKVVKIDVPVDKYPNVCATFFLVFFHISFTPILCTMPTQITIFCYY